VILSFLVLPFLLILIFTIKRVIDKTSLTGEVIYHVSFQVTISYILFILFFLQGFIYRFYIVVILISLLLVISLFYFIKENDLSFILEGVDKLEGIKNNIIILLVTIIPLYVFMTIFRYQPWYLQLLFSFGITTIIFLIKLFLSNIMDRFFENFKTWFVDSDYTKYIYLWVIVLLLLIASLFIRIPLNNLKTLTNLNNNAKYWVFDRLPVDINNNFEQDIREELVLYSNQSKNIEDFYILEDFLYLSYDYVIEIYSLSEKTLVRTELLPLNLNETFNNEFDSFSTRFIYHNEYLYLIDYSGLYIINGEDIYKISHLSISNSNIFFSDDNSMRVLHSALSKIYQIYEVIGEEITLIETIDLNLLEYQDLVIISNSLFFKNENNYHLYYSEEIVFENIFGNVLYNDESKYMYFFEDNKFYISDGANTTKVLDLIGFHIDEGGVISNNLILIDRDGLKERRLLIFNDNMEQIALFNHLETKKFVKTNDYERKYLNYREIDGKIVFMQIDYKDEKHILQIYNLDENPVDLKLPFYTHFSYLFLFLIVIGVLIPISDNIKYVTYVDFISTTNKKDK